MAVINILKIKDYSNKQLEDAYKEAQKVLRLIDSNGCPDVLCDQRPKYLAIRKACSEEINRRKELEEQRIYVKDNS